MKFNDDADARSVLEENFMERGTGMIVKKDRWYQPTWQESTAIDYLCDEWDYAYDPTR